MARRPAQELPEQLSPGQLGEPVGPLRDRPAPGYRLRVAGWVTFAASYGIALIAGTSMMAFRADEWGSGDETFATGWKLLLPVVGPAVAAATQDLEDDWDRDDFLPAAVTLWIWTGIQATGLLLAGIGYWHAAAARRAAPADDEEGEEVASSRQSVAPRIVFTPSGPGGRPGLSLAGWF